MCFCVYIVGLSRTVYVHRMYGELPVEMPFIHCIYVCMYDFGQPYVYGVCVWFCVCLSLCVCVCVWL